MIFQRLGQFIRRAWPLVLVAWALLVLVTWYFAPPWSRFEREQESAFLPANSPSLMAGDMYAKAFPNDKTGSNVVLVLHRKETNDAELSQDLNFVGKVLDPGLRQIAEEDGGLAYELKESKDKLFDDDGLPSKPAAQPAERSIIANIRTPNTPGGGALLVSPDRQAMLVVVELTTEFTARRNGAVIDKVENLVTQLRKEGKVPTGLDVAITGSAVIGRDHVQAETASVRATGILTVLLVAGLLIFIYRAPLLALIPLATVYLAVQVSINVLALMAEAGWINLFSGLQIYITILAYGAGVDYSLFLTARYKEELDRGADPRDAVVHALSGVGSALVASAATVMCGIAMMMFAEFGKFREAGFAIPLCLLLVLLATLTFSPALLCLAGRWAFWPQKQRSPTDTAPASTGWFAQGGTLERIWEHVGTLLLRRAGSVWLVTVAVMAPFAIAAVFLYNHLSYDIINDLPAGAASTAGTRVLEQEFPPGMVGPVTLLIVDPHADFNSVQGRAAIGRLTDRLREQKQQLGLSDIRSLTAPLGITETAERDFSGLDLPKEARQVETLRAAGAYYLTDLGGRTKNGTRLELVLEQSPFAHRSVEALGRVEQAVRDALPDDMRADTQVYSVGTTASIRDLALVMQRDRRRIELLVLASVFLILVLLLREFMIPVYLLLSVLFSYLTTLGVTFAVFWLVDPAGFTGIDWKVAIFLFTILIAVGEDYNIFLMTRVREEQRRHGLVRGITEALDRTGPIISSCGVIMAGTFASLLLSGSLTEMKQLGFALAFGVLLDTFVVRPILVPAFLILLRTGRLSLKPGAKNAPQMEPEPVHSEAR